MDYKLNYTKSLNFAEEQFSVTTLHLPCLPPSSLPANILTPMTTNTKKFFWHQNEQSKEIATTWSTICKTKHYGRLGLTDIHDYNKAFSFKPLWTLLTDPNSLWARTTKAKYFPSTDILHGTCINNASVEMERHQLNILKNLRIASEGKLIVVILIFGMITQSSWKLSHYQ